MVKGGSIELQYNISQLVDDAHSNNIISSSSFRQRPFVLILVLTRDQYIEWYRDKIEDVAPGSDSMASLCSQPSAFRIGT
jgi:hypothetical protein